MTIRIEAECDQCGKRESADRFGFVKIIDIQHPATWVRVQTYGPAARISWYCSRECEIHAATMIVTEPKP